jgi:hypothetical protein
MGLLLLNSARRRGGVVAPVITSQPSSIEGYVGLTATFSVTATGGSLSYQWQKSDNSGVDWSDISGATSSSYTTPTLVYATDHNDQFRCVVTNSAGTVNSNAATLTVWSPALLTGLQLWLDAADSSTILEGAADTAEDGDLVTEWSDKSGNARHATATTTARPTYRAASQNGRGTLEFNGSSNFLATGAAGAFNFLHNGTDSLVMVVLKPGTSSNPNVYAPILGNNSGSSSSIGYSLMYDDRAAFSLSNTLSSFVSKGSSGQIVSLNETQDGLMPSQYSFVSDRLRASNATASIRSVLRVNNNLFDIVNNSSSSAVSASNHTSIMRIGSEGSGFFVGNIAEVIICNNPNTSSYTSLASYLTAKWGLDADILTASSLQRISAATSAYDAFPTLYDTDAGLVCLFRSGTNHVGSKGTITRALSTDDGATWSVTANVLTDATFDLRDMHGLVLSNGDLLCGTNLYVFGTPAAGSGGIYRSTTDGSNFTQVSTISPRSGYTMWYPFGAWHQIGSEIYAPIYSYQTAASFWRSEIWKTTDEGVTWSFVSQLAGNYNETSVISLGGSTWLAVARAGDETANQMAYFTSTDNMATWSSATLTTFGIQAVSPHLIEWDGDVWLFIGDRTGTNGIKAFKWTGSGFTGGGMVYGASGTDCGYPSAVVDANGDLQLVFYQQYTNPGVQHYKISKV